MDVPSHPLTEQTLQRLRDNLRTVYADRPWMVATDVAQSAVHQASELRGLGATSVFALGAGMGTGDLDPEVPYATLGVQANDMMGAIRASEAALGALPADIQARVDAWDPDRKAHVVRAIFSNGQPVAGRRCWGGRPPAWLALEDKTIIDAVWDRCGVARAPSQVVESSASALQRAHATLDRGAGTVWAADNRDGWHGGATGLRWVRGPDDLAPAAEWMAAHAGTVRIMPFLEGIPCSMHGIVFDSHVVALRPCEMVVLRRKNSMHFKYARAATFWDPPSSDRDDMRAMVRRVGTHLRETVGYRGVFTIDGIMSAEGFRPTELNPRFGAAIGVLSGSIPDINLYLVHLAIVEQSPVDWQPDALEAVLVHAADTHRRGGAMQVLDVRVGALHKADLVRAPAGWRLAQDDEAVHARAMLGPAPSGALLRVTFEPAQTPIGPPSAPRAVEALAFLADHWNVPIGDLEAARSVR